MSNEIDLQLKALKEKEAVLLEQKEELRKEQQVNFILEKANKTGESFFKLLQERFFGDYNLDFERIQWFIDHKSKEYPEYTNFLKEILKIHSNSKAKIQNVMRLPEAIIFVEKMERYGFDYQFWDAEIKRCDICGSAQYKTPCYLKITTEFEEASY
jgi:hypothetical protein